MKLLRFNNKSETPHATFQLCNSLITNRKLSLLHGKLNPSLMGLLLLIYIREVTGLITRKSLTASFIPIFLFILTSCASSEDVIINYPFLQKKDENITLLFSDDQFINEEGNYYDALLDVKRRFPQKVRSFNIIHSSERDLVRHYEINEYPTLLIIHNETVTIRVAGSLQKAEILKILEEILE